MPKFDKSIASVAGDVETGYRSLLSGKPGELAAVRPLIAAYRSAGIDFAAIDLLDRLKQWIANGEKTKRRRFLEKLNDDAKAIASDPNGTWRAWAYCARVFRYTGRFLKAEQLYLAALRQIGDAPATSDEADVFVDYAEFKAYLGHPTEALDILAKLGALDNKGWYCWVRAVIHHFLGYESQQHFPAPDDPSGTPSYTNKPGPEDYYHDANKHLVQARNDKSMPPQEVIDTYLLEAANWGAIARRRTDHGGDVGDAKSKAAAALATFMGAGSDPVNAGWTWTKERRGRLAVFFRPKLDGALAEDHVLEWRRKFRNHYRDNLFAAGLPDASGGQNDPVLRDGELDSEDDHGDDNEA